MIAVQFHTVDGQKLAIPNIRRYLHKTGMKSYVSAVKTYLPERNAAVRL